MRLLGEYRPLLIHPKHEVILASLSRFQYTACRTIPCEALSLPRRSLIMPCGFILAWSCSLHHITVLALARNEWRRKTTQEQQHCETEVPGSESSIAQRWDRWRFLGLSPWTSDTSTHSNDSTPSGHTCFIRSTVHNHAWPRNQQRRLTALPSLIAPKQLSSPPPPKKTTKPSHGSRTDDIGVSPGDVVLSNNWQQVLGAFLNLLL